ncbi:D-alanyl-D-alanine carboxypeptidase / D-alanyl-D-alanine-endopeptidase (penicillin-binding protein 4) [Pedococcus dokdonensis]|uniref:D-alanyl-D-alanine carboxypeptidase / D-alanyl-D-alanine-endopeptidase (Penicillin-binding protein 4) n=1 Tax=Pedococcus dokdonensis TaxID=443156 RepID=A0A1H0USX2_9MICO|nr:D-alanyl-D-alanine carboxypeptidase [Pedococcus dokdonensis]SDP69213.1 D-alanyl-D-alanine carboxypeptidase / D-alanyl-D-alanine-endopeptidase (penicillin-binding protein 4) [Pedococcus dokdonensis]
MRRFLAAALALVVLVVGYAALDVFDVVPGILTRDQPAAAPPTPTPTGTVTPTSVAVPTVDTAAQPLQPASAGAPIPAPAALAEVLAKAVADPALRPGPGVVVRDAFTGQTLFTKGATKPRVPASTAKLLTALAVGTTLDPLGTLPTTVVQGAKPTEIVLVAGGDTMLAKGKGAPTAVEGRAGLGDLAGQVAAALTAAGTTKVSLRLDTTFAKGPRWAPGWSRADIDAGFTGGVSMLGLAGQRAIPYRPAPRDPEAATGAAFVTALAKVGITATLARESTWSTPAPAGAAELGRVESAPIGDLLALALDESDNALTEGLARQASLKAGSGTSFAATVAFVRKAVEAQGIDLTGVTLKDTSGLTSGQAIPPQVLSDVLQLGADGSVPALQDTLARLPVAGLTGTLAERFKAKNTHAVAGVARAKTGTLTGTSAMAGTVIDADGRVLSYVVQADRLPAGIGTLHARAALDRFVAVLATCGCP